MDKFDHVTAWSIILGGGYLLAAIGYTSRFLRHRKERRR